MIYRAVFTTAATLRLVISAVMLIVGFVEEGQAQRVADARVYCLCSLGMGTNSRPDVPPSRRWTKSTLCRLPLVRCAGAKQCRVSVKKGWPLNAHLGQAALVRDAVGWKHLASEGLLTEQQSLQLSYDLYQGLSLENILKFDDAGEALGLNSRLSWRVVTGREAFFALMQRYPVRSAPEIQLKLGYVLYF